MMPQPTDEPTVAELTAIGSNNFFTLQTYDAGRVCRKCGTTTHAVRWCQGNNQQSACLGLAGVHPHLHVVCSECHHVRIEKSLDPDDQELTS